MISAIKEKLSFFEDISVKHTDLNGSDLLTRLEEDFYSGIVDTINGGDAMNPSIALKTLKLLRNPISIKNQNDKEDISLSKQEIEVLEQLSKGLSYTAIAKNLFLSPSTFLKHIKNIYKKLPAHSKIEAAEKAKNHNLI